MVVQGYFGALVAPAFILNVLTQQDDTQLIIANTSANGHTHTFPPAVHGRPLASMCQHSQRAQVMRHVWSLITSTVLESEQDPSTDCGDSVCSGDEFGGAGGIENASETAEQDNADGGGSAKNGGEGTDGAVDADTIGEKAPDISNRSSQ